MLEPRIPFCLAGICGSGPNREVEARSMLRQLRWINREVIVLAYPGLMAFHGHLPVIDG